MDSNGSTEETASNLNIRPGVSILSVLQHLNYKPWFALAEFVDNSLQSYLSHGDELRRVEGPDFKLRVSIETDMGDTSRLTIRDNAAGIHEADYPRAFRPAAIPPDRTGLSEFGMGMKSAACWFAPNWTVRTKALGETIERTVSFDIDTIVRDNLEELSVQTRFAPEHTHYTEIVLTNLHRSLHGRTIGKVKEHLSSIYRKFLREDALHLSFDQDVLAYEEPKVLRAPFFKEPDGSAKRWYKLLDLDFGLGIRAHGFAALRETGSVSTAGFALFRRKRLIQGSADETYRPELIFGKSNSYAYQRLFGEISLEGFDVSHTKDGFQWADYEEIVLEELRRRLDEEPTPLLRQAEGYRSRPKLSDLRIGAQVATERTAETIEREVPSVLQHQLADVAALPDVPTFSLPPKMSMSKRLIELEIDDEDWSVELELSDDASIGDWVSYYDTEHASDPSLNGGRRRVGIRLALAHPFMERFSGSSPEQIEPLLRVAVAIILGEITAREIGVEKAGTIRRRINELLRDALSKP